MIKHDFKSIFFALSFSLLALQKAACSPIEPSSAHTLSIAPQQTHQYTKSISELAAKAKSVVDTGVQEFNSESLPHQAKDLRKQIVRLRDILDVFSHNFAHELELWDDIRDGLDEGYTLVGDFKDLFDTNPDAVESLGAGKEPKYKDERKLKERRKKVLKWKSVYFAEGGLSEKIWSAFLNIRPLNSSNVAPSKKYSDFFWGGVAALPVALNTPAQNARILVDAQADWALEEHPTVLAIKDPTTHDSEILFHDHRKRLRTIAKVCNVANALTENSCNPDAVKDIEALVVELGEIEDLIITGRHLEEDDKKTKAKEAYENAQKKFKKLKKKFEDRNMLEPLDSL